MEIKSNPVTPDLCHKYVKTCPNNENYPLGDVSKNISHLIGNLIIHIKLIINSDFKKYGERTFSCLNRVSIFISRKVL